MAALSIFDKSNPLCNNRCFMKQWVYSEIRESSANSLSLVLSS